MNRVLLLGVLGLGAAAGGPLLYFKAKEHWPSDNAAEPTGAPVAQIPVEGMPAGNLAEIFRFDVTTGWVMKRWPRVSVGMSDPRLQGYRVLLMTGTEPSDLAGSLTYYFDADQKVERITFKGTTGDARKLVRLMTTRYRFVRRLTNDPGVFLYEAAHVDRDRRSILEFRLSPVVRADDSHHRFDVKLSIERPS